MLMRFFKEGRGKKKKQKKREDLTLKSRLGHFSTFVWFNQTDLRVKGRICAVSCRYVNKLKVYISFPDRNVLTCCTACFFTVAHWKCYGKLRRQFACLETQADGCVSMERQVYVPVSVIGRNSSAPT